MRSIELLVILQFLASVHSSHVQDAKSRIRQEIRHELGGEHLPPPIPTHQHHHHRFSLRRDPRKATHIFHQKPRRFSHRKRLGAYYTPWTGWTKCNSRCRQTRERYCKVRRRCGEIKHLEERICDRCRVEYHDHSQPQYVDRRPHKYVTSHRSYHLPVYEEIDDHQDDDHDYYVLKTRYKKKRKPIVIEVEDYQDLEDEDDFADRKYNKNFVKSIRTKDWNNQYYRDDVYQSSVEEFDNIDRSDAGDPADQGEQPGDPGEGVKLNQFGPGFDEDDDGGTIDRPQLFEGNDNNNEYDDDDEEDRNSQLRNETIKSPPMEKAVFEVPRRRKRIYSRWSKWSKCSPKCTTRRYKKCRIKRICGKEVLREIAYCYTEGSFCQQWLEGQVHKTQAYNPRPMAQNRKDVLSPNAIANDYILSGKGYRAPEYTPLKLKCGIPMIRNSRRNMYNMLKIIGGRTSRKGQWPWQVVIFNRFREAFCGGTLIAPNWILTAAHCVRKVLYVRLGEHNLDIQDGTEVDYRVLKSIKHPNYDKKTVDSDVALLRLPEPVNATNWIGFACMPRPYQPLPKNVQCTVIGWGKRRNNDQAGTSVLHQAEVPIIPMENCKAVYYDYTITKNMFCAGHKRGRIDTCAGDSGGPLLCRDMTKPNHPWTIFGITSFGDGCAKKNKFGIYAKVPNYVDWVWSVVNCNGNCKSNYSRL